MSESRLYKIFLRLYTTFILHIPEYSNISLTLTQTQTDRLDNRVYKEKYQNLFVIKIMSIFFHMKKD